jgi:hypothetical protein
MATLNPTNITPIAGTIRERMAGYAAVLTDVLALLDAPTSQQVTPADRRAITHLLRAMTDVGALGNYHLNCRRRRSAYQTDHLAQYLADTRAKVARLTSRARP